jgi:cytochrome c oxidase cbb3-type subunit 3
MSNAVSLFIAVFSLANIFGCLWMMWWTSHRGEQPAAQEKTVHVWDGDLEEYNNPLPLWWLGLFILTIVFGLGYLVLYPGLGAFAGTSGWTQLKQYDAEVQSGNALLEARFAPLASKDLNALAHDVPAMTTAKNLFSMNCAGCHGSDARGAKGFPNLTDTDWLWGGQSDTIYQTIAQGRTGVMPAWGPVLGPQAVEKVAAYVLSLSGSKAPADWVAEGKVIFAANCAACHGADARGNPLVGAPNLTDNVWLYGSSLAQVRETIANGRSNQMPAQLDFLGETRVRLLAAYVLHFSQQQTAAAPVNDPVVAAAERSRQGDASAGQ